MNKDIPHIMPDGMLWIPWVVASFGQMAVDFPKYCYWDDPYSDSTKIIKNCKLDRDIWINDCKYIDCDLSLVNNFPYVISNVQFVNCVFPEDFHKWSFQNGSSIVAHGIEW